MRPIALLFAICAVPAGAQPSFGARVGVNAATLTPQMFVDGAARAAPAASVFAQIPVHGRFSARAEVHYSSEGVRIMPHSVQISGGNGFQVDGGGIHTEYIGLGAFAAVDAPVRGLSVGAYAGPAVSVKVRERNVVRVDGQTFSNPSDLFYPAQATVAVGATVGRGSVGLDVRYALSVHDMRDPNAVYRTRTVRSSVATAALVYRIGR